MNPFSSKKKTANPPEKKQQNLSTEVEAGLVHILCSCVHQLFRLVAHSRHIVMNNVRICQPATAMKKYFGLVQNDENSLDRTSSLLQAERDGMLTITS